MKERKDELRRKRGALELNSDLDLDADPKPSFVPPQRNRADLPSGVEGVGAVSVSHDRVNFRSKLHAQIKQQEKEAKEQMLKNYMEKQERNERVRNYSKNVKDLYAPGGKRASKSQRPIELTDNETTEATEDRKNFLMHDSESGITKEIRPRLRSGATNQRANNQSEQATPNSLADKHAKRLKVAKSSRVTLGANDGGKPPRIGAGKNMMPEIDLTLSN